MGLGHQRATYPLRKMANDAVYRFGEDAFESANEKRLWALFQKSYEFLSRTQQFPLVGPYLFNLLEKLQNISPYYPFRDQSRPSLQVKSLYSLIKRGMGHSLASKLSSCRLSVVTSFYAAAMAMEELTDLPVYCIICDADINRVWVAENPKKSRIIYFAPCGHAMKRLKQYGVPDERIYLTGFPLPQENIGGFSMSVLRSDLGERLVRLDPTFRFRIIHGEEARYYLGQKELVARPEQPIAVTYAVGGAGAQVEIARDVVNSLSPLISTGKIKLNLVAGVRSGVKQYFTELLKKSGLKENGSLQIIHQPDTYGYFKEFNRVLRTTDVLWTKPSELSFYCGLGIPIITAPCIGPHEAYNKLWLQQIGAGIPQEDPRYCSEWITDFLNDGQFARSAWDGFLYARKMGIYKIQEVLNTGSMEREISPLRR